MSQFFLQQFALDGAAQLGTDLLGGLKQQVVHLFGFVCVKLQHRYDAHDSVIKVNHQREPFPAVPPTGYVGLTTGACMARLGHDVVCADVDPSKVERLRRGEIPILEHRLDELVAEGLRDGRLRFTTDSAEAVSEVEPALVYSIARQESWFNPKTVSSAKAMGFMQVTPQAGKYLAKKFNVTYDEKRLLSDNVYNLQMGAAELGDVIKDYRGSYILAFAAYNAGRGRDADEPLECMRHGGVGLAGLHREVLEAEV